MLNHSDLPTVSIEAMNTMHYEEVDVINAFLQELTERNDFTLLSEHFEKLLTHMQKHFESEEKLMEEAQYPSFRMHKADHDKVLNEARYSEMEWRNRKDVDDLKEYLNEELLPWLDQHIKAMDVPMADFISQFEKYRGY